MVLETTELPWPRSVSWEYHKSVDQGFFSLEPIPGDALPPLPLADPLSLAARQTLSSVLQPHKVGWLSCSVPPDPGAFLGHLSCRVWSLGIQSVK